MTTTMSRRHAMMMAGAASLASTLPGVAFPQAQGRIVVLGGGFGGATCARYLRRIAPELEVTLVEENPAFVTCPFSNTVIAGLNPIEFITHGFDGLRAQGVNVVTARAEAIDAEAGALRLAGGEAIAYDRLVLSPGIDMKWNAVEGYDAAAAEVMPHAWKAGPQTTLLRRQLEAMEDGGTVVIAIPDTPYRCPPGPYERASLIAHYLKTHKPRSKLILLDAKDGFSKQGLFQEAWRELYAELIEWVPFSQMGMFIRVDPSAMSVHSDFVDQRGDVVNFIPPQRAATIVDSAGLTDGGDWCVIDQRTFESNVVPGIHVLGDAAIAGAMPKSGFSAGSQAKYLAFVIASLQSGEPLPEATFVNTCYSLIAPDYGISVADIFRIDADGMIASVEGAGGLSPTGADSAFRQGEADYARGWYASQMAEIYG
jgi:sulfide dehydrogenase [flavocytochrome c] flavoprotein chain